MLVVADVHRVPAVLQPQWLDGRRSLSVLGRQDHAYRRGKQAGVGHPVAIGLGQEPAGRERVHQCDRRAHCDGRCERVVLRVRVEHGQHDQLAVVRLQVACGRHGGAGECVVGLSDLDALRGTGSSRGEHDGGAIQRGRVWPLGERLGVEHRQFAIGLVDHDDTHVGVRRRRQVGIGAAACAETDHRSGALDVAAQFRRGPHRIAGHDPRTQASGCQPHRDERGRIGQRQVNRVSGAHAVLPEVCGSAGDHVVELAVRPLQNLAVGTFEQQERRVGCALDRLLPQGGERGRLGRRAHVSRRPSADRRRRRRR